MPDLSHFWLRVAAALYSAGAIYVLDYLIRRGTALYRPALAACRAATVFHFVAVVEHAAASHNEFEALPLLALALAVSFLAVDSIYEFENLGLVGFPIIAALTWAAALKPDPGTPAGYLRDAWLLGHVLLNIGGFTSTLFMAIASLFYLMQERHLKTKEPIPFFESLPPLHALDQLATRAMFAGFAFTTLGVVAGSGWAYVESGTRWTGEGRVHISLFTWAFYLAVVFLRTIAGWRGRRAAFLAFYVLLFSTLTWVSHSGLRPLLAR